MRESLCRKSFFPDIIKILKLAQGAVHPQDSGKTAGSVRRCIPYIKGAEVFRQSFKRAGREPVKRVRTAGKRSSKSDETPGSRPGILPADEES